MSKPDPASNLYPLGITDVDWDYYGQLVVSDLPYTVCDDGLIIYSVLYIPID